MKEFLVKSEEVSDPRFGEYPGARDVESLLENGIVVIDKPSGPTSHQVTAWVRDMLGLEKAGHSGTLDPKTTGVLVIALEKATKIMEALMGLDKEYVSIMHLHDNISDKKLKITLDKFEDKIVQKPPVKSSVKREERVREIYSLDILDRDGKDVLLKTDCEAGTYIRKLIHDVGEDIGGAHMKELRRTRVGPFAEDGAYKLQDLKDNYVLWKEEGVEDIRKVVGPVEASVEHLKSILVKDTAIDSICHGAPLGVGGVSKLQDNIKAGDMVSISSLKGELIALGEAKKDSVDILNDSRGKAADLERVIMDRNTYPSSWKNV